LKERSASLAPSLPCICVLALDSRQQQSRELFDRERIGTGRNHQLAQLMELAVLQLPGLVAERLQFGVKIAGFTNGSVLVLRREDGSVIAWVDQSQSVEISWDFAVPRLMKSFEGALIRRADVLFQV
jgi:hypothetical protein